MSQLFVSVQVSVFGSTPDGQDVLLQVTSPHKDYPSNAQDIGAMAEDCWRELRFCLVGGTGNSLDPWFGDQPERGARDIAVNTRLPEYGRIIPGTGKVWTQEGGE